MLTDSKEKSAGKKNQLKTKKFFLEKIFVFFTKYTLFAEKKIFIWKKILFTEKI